MTKEEAWLMWMSAAKTTDTPIEIDFEVIKKTSWWAAFSAGWDAATINTNGWDDAYKKGIEVGKEIKKEWVGLTDEEVQQVYMDTEQMVFESSAGNGSLTLDFPICIYRAIEAKLKEKNT